MIRTIPLTVFLLFGGCTSTGSIDPTKIDLLADLVVSEIQVAKGQTAPAAIAWVRVGEAALIEIGNIQKQLEAGGQVTADQFFQALERLEPAYRNYLIQQGKPFEEVDRKTQRLHSLILGIRLLWPS